MPTSAGETNLEIIEAIKSGKIKEDVLDECVERMLELIFTTEKALQAMQPEIDVEKHHSMAQKVAEESIVLLKNQDQILPISKGTKVAVIGNFAQTVRYQGAGSSIVNPIMLESTLPNLSHSGLVSIGFAQGYDRYGKKSTKKYRKLVRWQNKQMWYYYISAWMK